MPAHKYIGHAVTRVDALDKVTGATVYGYDFVLPDMLYGKTVFSTRAHARITVWSPTDAPFRAREELAQAFGCAEETIRVLNPFQGGGFGAKGGLKVEPIALALAFHTNGRPVKVKFNREETFRSTLTRHAVVTEIKSGIMRNGQIRARDITLYWDAGAYAEKSATVCIRASLFAPGP